MPENGEEFTLRVSKHGDFGKTPDERGERRSVSEIHGAGFRELEDDALRLHERAIKARRGPAERPLRHRDEER